MLNCIDTNINKQFQTELNKAYFHMACVPCTAGRHPILCKEFIDKAQIIYMLNLLDVT